MAKNELQATSTFDKWTDRVIKAILAIIGIGSFVSGIVSGMWHCYMFAAMCVMLYWAIKSEEGK